jgi:hypothetical protein
VGVYGNAIVLDPSRPTGTYCCNLQCLPATGRTVSFVRTLMRAQDITLNLIIILPFLAYCAEMKVGLSDHLSVCVSPLITSQPLDRLS